MTPDDVSTAVEAADGALRQLATSHPDLATPLARLIVAVADEAARSGRFASALRGALASGSNVDGSAPARRSGRRAPGVIDPFAVFGELGETGLRRRLADLNLAQLRDIVAQHGMDHDRLAMKWKDPARVVDRIVERVAARAAKGSAFRQVRD